MGEIYKKFEILIIKVTLACVLYISTSLNLTAVAQDVISKEVPIILEIKNTAINRVVAHQWANLNQQSWSGSFNDLNYTITLNKPTVVLETNKIITQISMDISSNAGGRTIYNGTISINPEVVIPANTIHLGNIVTQYVNLRQSIEQISQLTDARLRDIIEDILSPIDWVIYFGNAVEQSQVRWTDHADIRWSELPEITYVIENGSIVIEILPKILSANPLYRIKVERDMKKFRISVISNNVIDIKRVKIYTFKGDEIFPKSNSGITTTTHNYDNQTELYTNSTEWLDLGVVYAVQSFPIEVLFKRNNFEVDYKFITAGMLKQDTFFKNASVE